ncbi:MAG: GNAT family N-acetyltransferase [Bacteroidetes bacterium]|nr:GNAT family N-acetyltransferase [Bacteroidota bacterium]
MDNENPLPDVHFKRINAQTVVEICKLSETLSPQQQLMVTDNAISIAQAHFSENAWMRAIYADETPVGFIMLHIGSDYDDGIDCPGAFLWRLMIAAPFQGEGYGRQAIERLLDHLRAQGVTELYTSVHLGEQSPEEFYKRLGFERTGEYYGDEPELKLKFS